MMTEEKSMTWDLSDLFSGLDDPRIEETLSAGSECADRFAEQYRGKINSPDLTPEMLNAALTEYGSILEQLEKPLDYASLMFAADTSDPARGSFMQTMRERYSQIIVKMVFFELELDAIPEDRMAEILASPVMEHFRHYVHAERLFREHKLSEPEEKILEEKSNTGRRAFARLFEETVSNIRFSMPRDGHLQILTLPEVLALQHDPDRQVRRAASESLTEGLQSSSRTLTFVFNTLMQDKSLDDRFRRYEFPEQSRHLSNELDRETVDLVVRIAVEYYDLVARYYRLKREILGYDRLMHYDRYAPVFPSKEKVPFEHGRQIVLDSFGGFSPDMSHIASTFFEKQWIDAEIRPGKRGGAFCSYVTPDLHPYVFVNYLDRMDDVMTLGHELGHAVHACLSGKQGYLNFAPTLPVAELASTFGEMLVFEALQRESSLEEKLSLYAQKIEGAFATIFRQAAMYRFEQAIHHWRREKGELTTEDFSSIWQSELQAMFGDSVELGDEHRFWWMYVSHFIGSPFYVYAYTFGELLVMSLYAMYKREGADFVPRYIQLLEVGGFKSPADMLSDVGIDIHDPAFWREGIQVLEGFIDQFEELYRQSAGSAAG